MRTIQQGEIHRIKIANEWKGIQCHCIKSSGPASSHRELDSEDLPLKKGTGKTRGTASIKLAFKDRLAPVFDLDRLPIQMGRASSSSKGGKKERKEALKLTRPGLWKLVHISNGKYIKAKPHGLIYSSLISCTSLSYKSTKLHISKDYVVHASCILPTPF